MTNKVTRILGSETRLDTPVLLVDRDLLQENIGEMAAFSRGIGVNLRPHIKTHKTPEIARLQIESGAVGIMCAKLSEAEVFADAGIGDIAIGFQLVGEAKLDRLVALLDRCRVTATIDSVEAADALSRAMVASGKEVDVYIEVDTGHHRAGVLAGEPARDLTNAVAARTGLRVRGVMTHEGHANAAPPHEIEAKALAAGRSLVETAEMIRAAGVPIDVVSVGSTPCAFFTPTVPGVTEMRPGTYVFRDTSGFRHGRFGPDRCAARYLATVANRPADDRAILDSGAKTLALDLSPSHPGHGYIIGHSDAIIDRLSEEHGVVILPTGKTGFEVGDTVEIIPNHVCPSVNLHQSMTIVQNGQVIDQWQIMARGKVT